MQSYRDWLVVENSLWLMVASGISGSEVYVHKEGVSSIHSICRISKRPFIPCSTSFSMGGEFPGRKALE